MLAFLRRHRGAAEAGNSVLTARMLDALARPGCPLCRVLAATAGHHLAALLDERVTLPHAHRELQASRGFCGEHAWALPPAALAAQSARGAAMLHAPLLAALLDRWPDPGRRRHWLTPERPCPLCAVLARSAAAYPAEFAALLRRGAAPALASTPCLPHLRVLAPRLLAATLAGLAAATARARRDGGPGARLALGVGFRPVDPFPAAPACPVCAAATAAALATAATRDVCRAHAWAHLAAGHQGIAAVEPPPGAPGACPACRAGAAAADAALATRQPAHRLCLGHLRRALGRDWLDGRVAYWSLVQLERDLARFVASGSATFAGTLTAGERRSWLVALARFGGEAPGAGLTAALPWWPAAPE